MFGAKKYAPFNWQLVVRKEPERYLDAAIRHIADYQAGERREKESGELTLAHAICCLIFLLWNDLTLQEVHPTVSALPTEHTQTIS